MAAPAQVGDDLGREAGFQLQRLGRLPPRPAEQPARRRDRGGGVHAVDQRAREHRALRLRLAVTAHVPVDHGAPVLQQRHGGVKRVEGLAARLQRVERALVQAERAPAVLPADAARAEHDPRAELVIDALDEAHRASFAVDDAHPDRVGRAFSRGPRGGAAAVDPRLELVDRLWREKALRIDRHVRGVGNVLVADHERPLHRLDAQVDVVRAERIEPVDPESVELPEDQEADEPLRRRRHVEDASERVLEHERRAPLRLVRFEITQADG